MAVSVFDLFKIGIGPSSSHTVGPMRAALLFTELLRHNQTLLRTQRIEIQLYGSLGATGKGHHTDIAVLLGLMGHQPDTVDIDTIPSYLATLRQAQQLSIPLELNNPALHQIPFNEKKHLLFFRQSLAEHPNGLRFFAYDANDDCLETRTYLSVGGGFVSSLGATNTQVLHAGEDYPYPFESAERLLEHCQKHQLSISDIMLNNESTRRSQEEIKQGIDRIWHVMQQCVIRGTSPTLIDAQLPGPLQIKRRAPALYATLTHHPSSKADPLQALDWVNLWAMAVNEENAAGGRVVTAPTNGASGVIPAVLHYYHRFTPEANHEGTYRFFLTATAIGMLYKLNASISGAEVGCQGEIGVASSMAASGLTAALGGTPEQCEQAAEIAMEHHLGMTCDPVGGRVQIPCIERNAMGAVKAINATRMALHSNGQHYVSLDKVIKTMKETGADMKTKYKETSRGGLAVNIIEC